MVGSTPKLPYSPSIILTHPPPHTALQEHALCPGYPRASNFVDYRVHALLVIGLAGFTHRVPFVKPCKKRMLGLLLKDPNPKPPNETISELSAPLRMGFCVGSKHVKHVGRPGLASCQSGDPK